MADEHSSWRDDAMSYIHASNTIIERLTRCTEVMHTLQELEQQVGDIRRQEMSALHTEHHWSFVQISEAAGISPARVRHIVTGYTPPARPGVMEQRIGQAAAAAKARHSQPVQQVADIHRQVKAIKGIGELTPQQWSRYSGIEIDTWRDFLE